MNVTSREVSLVTRAWTNWCRERAASSSGRVADSVGGVCGGVRRSDDAFG